MRLNKSAKVVGTFSVAGVATVITTLLVSGAITSAAASSQVRGSAGGTHAAPPIAYARNALGLTYGSELQADTPSHLPDLISAIATNGQLGYVKRMDLYPATPANPQQALAQQAAGSTSRIIQVYALNGITVIGTYEIQPGGSGG